MIRVHAHKKSTGTFLRWMVLGVTVTLLAGTVPDAAAQEPYRAVIVRGAGLLPGTEAPAGSDAITHATSEPGNTYVFTEQLADAMNAQGIETEIVDYFNTDNLACIERPGIRAADMVIFAGPSYNRVFPAPLTALLPTLAEIAGRHPEMVCSSLISVNFTYRGLITMMWFDDQLRQSGVRTVTGLVFNSDVIQQERDEDVKDFVDVLLTEMKK